MAGSIPLFEKDRNGLLHQVAPADADSRRQGRQISSVNIVIDVLWTDAEEELKREQERSFLAAQSAQQAEAAALAAKKQSDRSAAVKKLEKLGLSPEEIASITG